ncbi:MAG: Cell division ATP-binding protein FtsE [Candidatus Magasanikbacteria bacterium GW2011_GWA2_45_39]|uniref:Cell division ATP-binding protein FtsE n=2 Tax=Candidatus Magasanikiibacteriota TaxID=1752731 RepID=A0A0G1N1J3_9BACT|nr:MAG: Cell division ATP-binding protein FtsE [Candidatus Magasanikbacteria bacterium GW2011_GWA2_45_39]KKU14202.1 MAG: Cell division ATP-binding protein FtsE [Candidatus Magasanikbacteria bacterium GW2011_GWC2_45_8]HBW73775.1 cell division ATP-binding protein FtsE [Candidatus Magasanikbacteria bacterium]
MIYFKNVSKIYEPQSIGVRDIHLQIESGEFVSIVGQSGSGKTTLVKLMIAEERPSKGIVKVSGWDIASIPKKSVSVLRRQIGVIFQDFKLLHNKTLFENVAFALEVCGVGNERINEIVPQVLQIVGLEGKRDRYPHQVSGGEQQRAVIARSLVHRPKILVADEPTGNLDAINTHEIIEILKKINEFGTTVVLVTHNKEVVNSLRRRVVTLEHGTVVSDQEGGKYVL